MYILFKYNIFSVNIWSKSAPLSCDNTSAQYAKYLAWKDDIPDIKTWYN